MRAVEANMACNFSCAQLDVKSAVDSATRLMRRTVRCHWPGRCSALLLALLLSAAGAHAQASVAESPPGNSSKQTDIERRTSIESASAVQSVDGYWELRLVVLHSHPKGAKAYVRVLATAQLALPWDERTAGGEEVPVGRSELTIPLERPRMARDSGFTTDGLRIRVFGESERELLAELDLKQQIQWPDRNTAAHLEQVRGKTPEQLVDFGEASLAQGGLAGPERARRMFERALSLRPAYAPAYIGLARLALSANDNELGLRQAALWLGSALKFDPSNAEAQLLLGHVLALQNQQAEAEKLFEQASRSKSASAWLWVYWGNLREQQGREVDALQQYWRATERSNQRPTEERAHARAFTRLVALLERRGDSRELERAHERRIDRFGLVSCVATEYARFLVHWSGQYERALEVMAPGCSEEDDREVRGLAYYAKWADTAADADRLSVLSLARTYLPTTPTLWLAFAHSDRMTEVARKLLLEPGMNVDEVDSESWTALALALQARDQGRVGRLLQLGARADRPVGREQMPAALIPVFQRNLNLVKLLAERGVDYAALRYQGVSALTWARQIGGRALVEAMGAPGSHS
ncbi:MAG: hypothetical protein U1E77_05355 [Inhella sp.]